MIMVNQSRMPTCLPTRKLVHEGRLKTRFQEERKGSFHREGLPDYTAGFARKSGPVSPKLELHRYSGNHTDGKVDREDSCPEARRLMVLLVRSLERDGLEQRDQQREPHRELREQVVEN